MAETLNEFEAANLEDEAAEAENLEFEADNLEAENLEEQHQEADSLDQGSLFFLTLRLLLISEFM